MSTIDRPIGDSQHRMTTLPQMLENALAMADDIFAAVQMETIHDDKKYVVLPDQATLESEKRGEAYLKKIALISAFVCLCLTGLLVIGIRLTSEYSLARFLVCSLVLPAMGAIVVSGLSGYGLWVHRSKEKERNANRPLT